MFPRSLQARVTALGALTLALVFGVGAWVTVRALEAGIVADTQASNNDALDELEDRLMRAPDPSRVDPIQEFDGTVVIAVDSNCRKVHDSLDPEFVLGPDVPPVVDAQCRPIPGALERYEEEIFAQFSDVEEWEESEVFLDEEFVFEAEFDVDDDAEPAFFSGGFNEELADTNVIQLGDGDWVFADQWAHTERSITTASGEELRLIALYPGRLVDRSIDRLALTMMLVVPSLVLLGATGLWLAIRAALSPVQRMTDEAIRIAPSNSGVRLPVPDSGDEIADLALNLNDMLDRLDAGLVRQRRFVSDASHELRSPLTTVRAAAELLADDPEIPPSLVPTVEVMSRGAGRLEAVLDDLTGLAAAGTASRPTEVDLADLVADEIRAVSSNPNRLEPVAVDVAPMVVRVHEVQLGRALANLLTNAVRHAREKVEVRTEVRHDTRSSGIVILVDDDGPGVPPAHRQRIFDRFVRLDDSRSRREGGSGLGLALVASIAEHHGGSVACEDSPLGGARFVLRLPL